MKQGNFITLHRKLKDWGWYQRPEMLLLLVDLLLSANFKDSEWEGKTIKRGQVVTGLDRLHKNTGLSTQTIRTCLNRLKSTGEITSTSTNKYRIITLVKYNDYQDKEVKLTSKSTSKLTNKQQTSNKQATASNNTKQEETSIVPAKADTTSKEKELEVELIDYYIKGFVEVVSDKKPIFDWGVARKMARPHIKNLGIDRMKELLEAYIYSKDKLYKDNAYSITCFLSIKTINNLNIKN